ncbi:FAD-dependent oxidoreductase [Listeria costaricensis]|uniref:FAD-dependent oxidoreductase n=1 Tax=Listeria costaricensis TaxID=2026604 RepID=UPI000C0754B5|nr:FAD-dependent oxidoreductase [Listeria costaricensis]
MKRVVIVGGVAGGMSAATRLRRLNEELEIIIFEKGPYVSFANCGLPYYIGGEITERSDLLVQTPEQLKARFNLDVRPFHEVTEVLPEEKVVVVRANGQTERVSYDKLILSPGAKPFIPPAEGIDEAENLFTVRNVPDVDRIMQHMEKQAPKRAVVIGAGFIGLEMAENLAERGLHVTVVEKAPHVLPPLDTEMAAQIERELVANKVEVRTGVAAEAFLEAGRQIRLDDGTRLAADLIILAVGVTPAVDFLEGSGIETGLRGAIVVNENYQTNLPDVWAIGDAVVVKHQVSGKDALISLASPANRQGRITADILNGQSRPNSGFIGTAIVRVFGQTAATTGLNEHQLQQMGMAHQAVHIQSKNHAGYYPGAVPILLKVLFDPQTGKLLGAQAVGENGVDKRIDVLATALKAEMSVFDLPELELTYAPPFGSAKDPVNMAGYAAMNLMEGMSENIQWHELMAELEAGAVLLDVRNPEELRNGHFEGALNIPLNDLRNRMSELSQETNYIVTCQVGLRGYIAERQLKNAGFHVKNLDGGFSLYQSVSKEGVEK